MIVEICEGGKMIACSDNLGGGGKNEFEFSNSAPLDMLERNGTRKNTINQISDDTNFGLQISITKFCTTVLKYYRKRLYGKKFYNVSFLGMNVFYKVK